MRTNSCVLAGVVVGVLAGSVSAGVVETREFRFPRPNMSTFAAIFDGDTWIDSEIVSTSIDFRVEVLSGSAADIHVVVDLPIVPDDGNLSSVVINGSDLGWSGTGVFEYSLVTDLYNGTGRSGSYGAEFPTPNLSAVLLDGSGITVSYVPVPAPASAGLLALGALACRRRR